MHHLIRIVAYKSREYVAEIWMSNYFEKDTTFRDLCFVKMNSSSVITPALVAGDLGKMRGWCIHPHDPKFKLGTFKKMYRLSLPEWTLEELDSKGKPVASQTVDVEPAWKRG